MDLRDALNQYYYDTTVCDLRQLSRTGGGELSYNSIMYLDVISFQEADGGCTVGRLAKTLRISAPAATLKVNELVKMGLVEKSRSETDRRVIYVCATEKYNALRAKAATDVSGYFSSLLSGMSQEDRAMIAAAFQKLDDALLQAGTEQSGP